MTRLSGLLLPVAATAIAVATAGEEAYVEPEVTAVDRSHWAFQPVGKVTPPQVVDAERRARNGIDAFLLTQLEAEGLGFAAETSRGVLLRRVTLDLTGLPPTPVELEDFLADRAPGAYGRVVDRLLASPLYGERWAQHWLDVARFAESDGFEHDKVREEAWRYRDWVIAAINDDLPYDDFVRFQLAGDELAGGKHVAATGFLLCGPDMPDINDNDERRHRVLNEMTSAVGSAFLGLTLGCASCHDHKSDPVSQADFYRFRGFFENFAMPGKNKQLPPEMVERGPQAEAAHLMVRGDFRRPGQLLEAGFLRVVNPGQTPVDAIASEKTTGLRSALASWIGSPDHPLTARVAVNRMWMHHFGWPLAGTPNDFGVLGQRPSHPELLDWLAAELVKRGWSVKAMHRLIVTSTAYRQASFLDDDGDPNRWATAMEADPGNRLLWRMNRRRMSGETLRDLMLSVAGALSESGGGPGIRPPLPPEVTVTLLKDQWPVTEGLEAQRRRSVYLFVRRNLRFPMFDVFDRPDGNASCGRRHVSTTATQALTLMNSPFSWEMAELVAARVAGEAGAMASPEELASGAVRCILGRRPESSEVRDGVALLENGTLADFCLGLMNLNEFVYLE